MYICKFCKEVVPPRTPLNKVVTKTREVRYGNGVYGMEIVEEVNACSACAVDKQPERSLLPQRHVEERDLPEFEAVQHYS